MELGTGAIRRRDFIALLGCTAVAWQRGNRTTLRNREYSHPRSVVQIRVPSQIYRLERVAGRGIIAARCGCPGGFLPGLRPHAEIRHVAQTRGSGSLGTGGCQ
jgi:hypothetical protein